MRVVNYLFCTLEVDAKQRSFYVVTAGNEEASETSPNRSALYMSSAALMGVDRPKHVSLIRICLFQVKVSFFRQQQLINCVICLRCKKSEVLCLLFSLWRQRQNEGWHDIYWIFSIFSKLDIFHIFQHYYLM